jgi:hypothetical protein
MPSKPLRRSLRPKPLPPPKTTRSTTEPKATSAKPIDPCKTPALAALISAALKISSTPPREVKPVAVGAPAMVSVCSTPPHCNSATVEPSISPSSKEGSHRKRRKREAIKLPPNVRAASMSAKELRRLKNRIAANRLRERSQQSQRELHEQLEYFRQRCEYLEMVVSGCPSCAALSAVQFGEIELLSAEPKIKKEVTSEEEELAADDGEPPVLTEVDCVVLDSVLHC